MKDKRMTNAQYLGALVLIFVLGFGAYTAGYKHGEEKLWGDIWNHHEKEIRYYYGLTSSSDTEISSRKKVTSSVLFTVCPLITKK